MYLKANSALDLLVMTVLAIAVAGLLYFGYFELAPWIWSQNVPIKPEEITPMIRPALDDRDGVELYALYVLMFANLLITSVMIYGWQKLKAKYPGYLLVFPVIVACAYIGTIGFYPPMSTFAERALPDILTRSSLAMTGILPIALLLYYMQRRSAFWSLAVAALLLAPVCFISTSPLNWFDYQYVFAPALRLLHGAKVSETYFQYDLFLSLIGLAWMKLQLDLNSFQIIGQASYYLLLLGAFAFSGKWLLDKRLPVFLLIAMVLMRIYAGTFDPILSFQATPLRLDLWLILLALVYFKGAYHWSAGLFCGLMLLLHHNFGIIYSAAYIQLLLTLSVLDAQVVPGRPIKTASVALAAFLRKNYFNLVLVVVCALGQYLLLRAPDAPDDYDYVRIGFGFIKIATNSFYWYVVIVSGLAFTLLFRLRTTISRNYLATGFCLIYLAIGNSLYFFGRSHENNIINISIVLLLLFFLLIDLAGRFLGNAPGEPEKRFMHRNLSMIISVVLIAAVTVWYGDSITGKVSLQAQNAGKGQLVYPPWVSRRDVMSVIAQVKSITGDNPKVYFVGDGDFVLDYYGGYAPVGYYNPVYAWISMNEFKKFLQGLVDQGYYIVVDNAFAKEVLSSINISKYRYIKGCVVAWK